MQQIDVEQAAAALEQGAVSSDVRKPAEHRGGHLPGARTIAMTGANGPGEGR